ncbi:hypothetical protein DDB_G0291299 [Dictyostelium discoideum AX4]|uniref:N(6)-L-threonylcarbamoyladenine synthase n=1 Tax=Dictyostelium discoideum TaxID=44689 RepID=Q54EW4_DICDI|nr:hypothetical protein DDB_G0291299 [Dictyostelium discoideum AX4]EAL61633.1 hypothetical protein DDB_G0291299 [Dictyostelium discoideum AX4]|eukprot:XP_635126.1 hypothetical protein DDB_G0291299 [Dictyostelium discoideum AX4]
MSGSGLNNNNINNKKIFNVIGIETSCDDTSIGIVNSEGKIMAEYSKPQWSLHKVHNGIVPSIAFEAHQNEIDNAIEKTLDKAGMTMEDIDVIAVTTGPGMGKSLEVGLNKAKQLYREFKKPFCSVNHMEGHSLVVRMENHSIEFPFLIVLVSGGHSQILICNDVSKYQLIGNTLDDSIGEALDKAARILGCPYGQVWDGQSLIENIHGGQAIEILASKGDPNSHHFTLPMKDSNNCDFSFSGIKSSLARLVKEIKSKSSSSSSITNNTTTKTTTTTTTTTIITTETNNLITDENELSFVDKCNLAASFQNVAFNHLEHRIKKSLDWYYNFKTPKQKKNELLASKTKSGKPPAIEIIKREPLKGIVVSGGVSKNNNLRKRIDDIGKRYNLPIYFPRPELCNDNGTMIAWAGVEMFKKGMTVDDPEKVIYLPVWPLDLNPKQIFKSNLKEKDKQIRKGWYDNTIKKYGIQ